MKSHGFFKRRRVASRGFQPRGEHLESRCMLACQVGLEEGVLTILGDRADDVVVLSDDGQGNVYVECADARSGGRVDFPNIAHGKWFREVDSVVVKTGGGDDTIRYSLVPTSFADSLPDDVLKPVALQLNGGRGDDVVKINSLGVNNGRLEFFDVLKCDVELGGGKNYVALDGKGGDVVLNVTGGHGRDTAVIDYKWTPAPSLDGAAGGLTANLQLLGGNDILKVTTTGAAQYPADSYFNVMVEVDLGGGRNLAMLEGEGGDINLKATGGRGVDTVITQVKPIPASPAGVRMTRLTTELNLRGGDDIVKMRAGGEDPASVESFFDVIKCDVNLGTGNDLVALDGKGNDVVLNVVGGLGADKVIVHAKPVPATLAGMPWSKLATQISLGGGNDDALLKAEGFQILQSRVNGDRGDDVVDASYSLAASANVDRQLDADVLALDVLVDGGRGQDMINARALVSLGPQPEPPDLPALDSFFDVFAKLIVDGGLGDDVINARALVSLGPQPEPPDLPSLDSFFDVFFDVAVFGGRGADELTLLAEDVAGQFLIHGGPGFDAFLASDNVQVLECEAPLNDLALLDLLELNADSG